MISQEQCEIHKSDASHYCIEIHKIVASQTIGENQHRNASQNRNEIQALGAEMIP